MLWLYLQIDDIQDRAPQTSRQYRDGHRKGGLAGKEFSIGCFSLDCLNTFKSIYFPPMVAFYAVICVGVVKYLVGSPAHLLLCIKFTIDLTIAFKKKKDILGVVGTVPLWKTFVFYGKIESHSNTCCV